MNCPSCAADLEEGARFCGACGKRIGPTDPPPEPAPPSPKVEDIIDGGGARSVDGPDASGPTRSGAKAASTTLRGGTTPASTSGRHRSMALDQTMLAPGGSAAAGNPQGGPRRVATPAPLRTNAAASSSPVRAPASGPVGAGPAHPRRSAHRAS